jgi:ubiquinone/menaquinone biosynthesis C-methylase UbiE
MASLAAHIEHSVREARAARAQTAASRGPMARLFERLDSLMRTSEREHLDDPYFPAADKLRIVQGLHLMNMATFSYGRFLSVLAPTLARIARRDGRPARLLELAGGTGGFALALAEVAAQRNIPVEVHGSDIVPVYVEHARAEAARRRLPVSFQLLDATDMSSVAPGAFDIVFVAQSMHHFSPGMLGSMIAEASRVARYSFVGIDGFRSLAMLAFVTGTAVLSLHRPSLHDAWISARSFYSHGDLRLIAELAAPGARVSTSRRAINTVLEVDFAGGP